MKTMPLIFLSIVMTGCATIVNDPMIPITMSFSDGSNGECEMQNKRGLWKADVPGTVQIRRSDDVLVYRCNTEDGRKSSGSVKSEIEGAKLGASVIFFDLGITDAITDKHRSYQSNIVIPVEKLEARTDDDTDNT